MSRIRPLEAADLGDVVQLYQDRFLGGGSPGAALSACLADFYLDGPAVDHDIPSLVHVDADGRLSGFVGVTVVPMTFSGRPLRAAFCGGLMVRDPHRDPLAGARLLKAFLSGPQDLSLSETANAISLDMWRAMRGTILASNSLEWMKIGRPASFSVDLALKSRVLRRLAMPAAALVDRVQRSLMPMRFGGSDRHDITVQPAGLELAEVDPDGFAEVVDRLTEHFALRPAWPEPVLRAVIAEAFIKPRYGDPVARIVTTAAGQVIGAFLYHMNPGGTARVFQILSRPGREEAVLDCLLSDAARRGAAGLRGRTQPALFRAMLGRGIVFANASSSVVYSRDEAILAALGRGDGFVNGIAGESWGRHIGGRF